MAYSLKWKREEFVFDPYTGELNELLQQRILCLLTQ